jgi:hypothetical protein
MAMGDEGWSLPKLDAVVQYATIAAVDWGSRVNYPDV